MGEHILLGGDNIDLALAHTVAASVAARSQDRRLADAGAVEPLPRWQRRSCWIRSQTADEYPVTILGKGSGLVGGTIKATLTRDDVQTGARRASSRWSRARKCRSKQRRVGVAGDRACRMRRMRPSRGIWRSSCGSSEQLAGSAVRPRTCCFNGGVLHAPFVRDRLLSVLNSWLDEGCAVQLLSGEDLMHAVARGAAYYGAARQGKGVRIRGGIPRSYYVGVESSMPAVPGFPLR